MEIKVSYEERIRVAKELTEWRGRCPHKWGYTGEYKYGNDYTSVQFKCELCEEITWALSTDPEPESAIDLFSERGFFELFGWAKEQEWFSDFTAFSNYVCQYGLETVRASIKEGYGFVVEDYLQFPIELVDVIAFPIFLYHFKKEWLLRGQNK